MEYYGVGQFDDTYSGDPAVELVTAVSSELLSFTDAEVLAGLEIGHIELVAAF